MQLNGTNAKVTEGTSQQKYRLSPLGASNHLPSHASPKLQEDP